jgi:hypothetical protein
MDSFYYRIFNMVEHPTYYIYVVSGKVPLDDIRYSKYAEYWIKIGITNDVPRRLSQLRNSFGKPLTLHFALGVKNKHTAYKAEQMLLNKYNPSRLIGEWFTGDIVQVVNDIAWTIEFVSNIDSITRLTSVIEVPLSTLISDNTIPHKTSLLKRISDMSLYIVFSLAFILAMTEYVIWMINT